jgi:hypothetical protein
MASESKKTEGSLISELLENSLFSLARALPLEVL